MKLFVLLLVIFLFVLWKKNQVRQKTWAERLSDALKDGLLKKGPFENPSPGTSTRGSTQAHHASANSVDELIACAICGVHAPKRQLVLGPNHQLQCAKHNPQH